MSRSVLLFLVSLTALVGCSSPVLTPPSQAYTNHLPEPRYVTHSFKARLGGSAWRAHGWQHALEIDGQVCGLSRSGAVCGLPPLQP